MQVLQTLNSAGPPANSLVCRPGRFYPAFRTALCTRVFVDAEPLSRTYRVRAYVCILYGAYTIDARVSTYTLKRINVLAYMACEQL